MSDQVITVRCGIFFGPVADHAPTISKLLWIGRVLNGLAIAFFVFDGVMKIIQPQGHVPSSLSLAHRSASYFSRNATARSPCSIMRRISLLSALNSSRLKQPN